MSIFIFAAPTADVGRGCRWAEGERPQAVAGLPGSVPGEDVARRGQSPDHCWLLHSGLGDPAGGNGLQNHSIPVSTPKCLYVFKIVWKAWLMSSLNTILLVHFFTFFLFFRNLYKWVERLKSELPYYESCNTGDIMNKHKHFSSQTVIQVPI